MIDNLDAQCPACGLPYKDKAGTYAWAYEKDVGYRVTCCGRCGYRDPLSEGPAPKRKRKKKAIEEQLTLW